MHLTGGIAAGMVATPTSHDFLVGALLLDHKMHLAGMVACCARQEMETSTKCTKFGLCGCPGVRI
jgi:hypothetical protein